MPARTITTYGLPGQHGGPWDFFVYDDDRTVAIPATGHPLDGPPVDGNQAGWVAKFSKSIEAKASHAWKFGPRVWKRFVATLEAHAADAEHPVPPIVTLVGMPEQAGPWRFELHPPLGDGQHGTVVLSEQNDGEQLQWLKSYSIELTRCRPGVYACESRHAWERLVALLEAHADQR